MFDNIADLLGQDRALSISKRLTQELGGCGEPEGLGSSDRQRTSVSAVHPFMRSMEFGASPDLCHVLKDACVVGAELGPYLERMSIVRKTVLSENDALEATRAHDKPCRDSSFRGADKEPPALVMPRGRPHESELPECLPDTP